jgi:hypothetical protein
VFIFLPAHKFRAAQYFADLAEKKKKKNLGEISLFLSCVCVCLSNTRTSSHLLM